MLLGAAGSIGLALVAVFASVWLGLRSQLKGATDDAERFALIRSSIVSALASVGFMIALVLVAHYDDGWLWSTLLTLVFMAIIFHQALVVQPRNLRRRHLLEAQRAPVAAPARRRRERWTCWLGATIGFVAGSGGLLYGLVNSGRV